MVSLTTVGAMRTMHIQMKTQDHAAPSVIMAAWAYLHLHSRLIPSTAWNIGNKWVFW